MFALQGESQIFPATSGGARALAEQYNCPYLGAIPLDPRIGASVGISINVNLRPLLR